MTTFQNFLIILSIAVIIVSLLRKLHLPPILGYLITGILVGPYAFKFLETQEQLSFIAEFGVVFLLFTIGLELSFPKLIAMRRALLGLGGGQVILCTAISLAAAYFANLSWPAAIAVAGAVTLSSTAVATKLLIERNELHQEHGKLSLSILLFQDLAAVPFLIIVPSFAATESLPITETLLNALLMGSLVFLAMLAIGRWLLRPLFHYIASGRSTELFMLATLLVVLVSAFITEHFKLSGALGAFLAGVMLAETEYVHQIESDIQPFRDILLGLFFITIGMLLNPSVLIHEWPWILAIVAGLIIIKAFIISLLAIFAGAKAIPAIRAGLTLAQGGEFGFALLAIAFKKDLIDSSANQIVIASIFISIAIAPFLIRKSKGLAQLLTQGFSPNKRDFEQESINTNDSTQENHVIICGYGRVGQTLAKFLEYEGIPFIGLDIDPLRLKEARMASEPVFFGNANEKNVLIAAGIEKARLIILAFEDDNLRTEKTLHHIRSINEDVPILVRTLDDQYLEQLQLAGATEVIPDKLESSLMLASHMLILLGTSPDKAQQQINEVKTTRYKILRGYFPGHKLGKTINKDKVALHAVELTAGAYAIGKTLKELQNESNAIELASFTRAGYKCDAPSKDTLFEEKDILVLSGTPDTLYLAEEKLLQG